MSDTAEIIEMPAKLTLKQRAFIKYYTSEDSQSFGNMTESYNRAYKTKIPTNDRKRRQSLSVTASQEGSKPLVKSTIESILNSYGYGKQFRLEALSKIGKSDYIHRTTSTQLDKDGNVTASSITESNPTAADVTRVVDTINKMTGQYAIASELGKTANKRLDSIYARMTKDVVKDVTPSNKIAPAHPTDT